jgi:hypothetical protein
MSAGLAEHGYGEDLRRRLRRRLALLAIAAGVALACAIGLWWTRALMTAGVPPGEAPLLRADGRPTKVRPADPGGMTVPGIDRLIYEPEAARDRVERLLPPPEEPLPPEALPRAAPPPEPPPPVVAAPEPPPAPAAPPVATAPPIPAAPPAPAAAPPPMAAAAPPRPPAKPAAGDVRVQLGAVRSEESAKAEGERLRRRHADLLGNLGVAVSRFQDPSRGTFFRIQAGPLESAAAERVCDELKKRKVGCIIVR